MVSYEPVLLIVAADRRELAAIPNKRALARDVRWAAETELGERPAILIANGPGAENIRSGVEGILPGLTIAALVSVGYAGAVADDLAVGDIVVADRVLRENSDVEYAVNLPEWSGAESVRQDAVLTVDRVIQTAAEKRVLRPAGVVAVDMEAAAAAEEAERLQLPFYCIRVISDQADEDFPIDFNRARGEDGRFSTWSVLWQAGLSWRRWSRLLDLRRQTLQASKRLAAFLLECKFPPQVKA